MFHNKVFQCPIFSGQLTHKLETGIFLRALTQMVKSGWSLVATPTVHQEQPLLKTLYIALLLGLVLLWQFFPYGDLALKSPSTDRSHRGSPQPFLPVVWPL